MNKRALDLVKANLSDSEYKAFLKGASLYFDDKAICEKNKTRASRFCKTSIYFQKLLREQEMNKLNSGEVVL